MTITHLKFHSVSFEYDSSPEQIFSDISFNINGGWTGIAGANGTGKSTLLKLCTGLLSCTAGNIESPENSIYCEQRTDEMPEKIMDFLNDKSRNANILKDNLKILNDWAFRWNSLSHGERKRIQLGCALWAEPDMLAVDEPTNHLDSYAKQLISEALSAYKGIGLLVSHDRELLDRLCTSCIFTMPPGIVIKSGGITKASGALKQEQMSVQKQYDIQKKEFKKLNREAMRRKQEALKADKKRSKKHIAPKDHDAKAKIDAARISGKDGKAGRLYDQLKGRLNQLQEEFENIKLEKKNITGIWMQGAVSKRDSLLKTDEDCLKMGEKELHIPGLLIRRDDRIAITGANGSGKSTLIKYILKKINTEPEHVTYVPQEIELDESKEILRKAIALEKDKLGYLMAIVSRLNSRPERMLSSVEPSPGEIRKLMLALGMTREPHVIIMDEPTNHLDLPSIECLESALSECPCALVLVSHDRYFLEKLTRVHWELKSEDDIKFRLKIDNIN